MEGAPEATRFALSERSLGDVTVLELAGHMSSFGDVQDFNRAVSRLVSRDGPRLILDLTQLMFIDSTGLGAIAVAHSAVRRAKGDLFLFHTSKRLENVFSLAGLLPMMYTADSVEHILPAFNEEPISIACPECDAPVRVAIRRTYQECARCALRLKLSLSDGAADSVEVQMMMRSPYDDQTVTAWPNFEPVRITAGGALGRMAFEQIQSFLHIMVRLGSKAVGIELNAKRDEVAFAALLQLCRTLEGCVIYAPGLSQSECQELSRGVKVFSNYAGHKTINYRVSRGLMRLPVQRTRDF